MKKECKDCKHCDPYIDAFGLLITQFAKCTNPKTTKDYQYCETQRTNGWFLCIVFQSCGKRGRYWEK